MRDYETNGPGDRKRHHTTDFKRSCIQVWLNREIFPVSGPMLQEEALQIAKCLNPESTFKASNGWLESFKKTQ